VYFCTMISPVKTKEELFQIIFSNSSELRKYGVKQLGVFGSFVRDEAKDDSDVDFLIDLIPEAKTFKNFMRLADFLESITGRKIEIVMPKSLSKYIGPYILKEVEYVTLAA
jgi:predicted nucleotidyltransferase